MSRSDERNRIDRAAFDRMVEVAGDDARSLAALAAAALWSGNEDRAYGLARRARALAPDDSEVRRRTRHALSAGVPRWHFPLIRDEPRNRAFEEALGRSVRPGMRVLDIGAGTGLLAMMAARAGAGTVISCERNEAIADAARDIVRLNGFESKIRIVTKDSTELDADADLGGRADLIVSEIVANDLLSEGVLPAMEDAARRLLEPGGIMIPAAGAAMVALAHWDRLDSERLECVCGFDVSPFNRLAGLEHRLDVGDTRLSLCSEAVSLFSFDFASGGPWRGGRASIALEAAAPANGVAQWVRLEMDPQGTYENRPGAGAKSHWAAVFTPFDPPRLAEAGQTVRVEGSYEPTRLHVWLEA